MKPAAMAKLLEAEARLVALGGGAGLADELRTLAKGVAGLKGASVKTALKDHGAPGAPQPGLRRLVEGLGAVAAALRAVSAKSAPAGQVDALAAALSGDGAADLEGRIAAWQAPKPKAAKGRAAKPKAGLRADRIEHHRAAIAGAADDAEALRLAAAAAADGQMRTQELRALVEALGRPAPAASANKKAVAAALTRPFERRLEDARKREAISAKGTL